MSGIVFNPMDPAFVADPYPTYHRLRAEDPVHKSPMGFWILTRYDDVVAALRDPRLAKEAIAAFVAARFGAPVPITGLSMLDRDPPDHTRLRGLVSKAFTPRVVEGLRPRIQQIVDGIKQRQPQAKILLVGMNTMRNLGRDYVSRFEAIYPELARTNNVPLVPSLLAGVGGIDSLNQPDGIHPTPAGHAIMAATVWRTLQPLLVPAS